MSGLPWLRLYSDMVDNGKIRLLAFEDRWHFVALLCIKQQGILEIKPGLLERNIAVKLGVQLRELDEVKRRLMEVELIDETWHPIGWDDHQFKSDSGAERMRKYRDKQRQNVTVTSPLRHSDVPDKKRREEKRVHTTTFTRPSESDLVTYAKEKRLNLEGFFHFYESNGWRVGKNPMKSWKSAATNWSRRQPEFSNGNHQQSVYGAHGI